LKNMERVSPIPEVKPMREKPFSFIGREPELQLIDSILEPGRQGYPMDNSIISFVGPWRIGKTALLQEIAKRFRKELGSASTESHPTITAYIDLGQLIREGKLDRKQLVREVCSQLWNQLGVEIDPPPLATEAIRHLSIEQAAYDLRVYVKRWTSYFTPIILFDTVDALTKEDEKSFWWIEKEIMGSLVGPGRTLFVLAGRQELRRWNQFQTRRKAQLERATRFLNSFDEETTGLQIAGSPAVNAAIKRHTFGHPEAAHYLAEVLEAQGLNLATASAEEVDKVLKEILPTVLDELTKEILRDVPKELKEIARRASVLRWISSEPLSFLAKYLKLEDEERIKKEIVSGSYTTEEGYYLDIIGQLQEAAVLNRNVAEADFRIPLPLRQLLDHALELKDPKAYGLAHQAAFLFHVDQLEQYPDYLARYVPEAIYHNLRLNTLEDEHPEFYDPNPHNRMFCITMAGPIDDWWPHHFDYSWKQSGKEPPGQKAWQELAEALEEDGELRALMHPATYNSFLKGAKQRAGLES
jgi:AAA+ ATPase superfamily predicted ATPase